MNGSAFHQSGANPKIRKTNPNSGRSACTAYPMGRRGHSGIPKFLRKNDIPMTVEAIDKYYLHMGYAEALKAVHTAHNEDDKKEAEMKVDYIIRMAAEFRK